MFYTPKGRHLLNWFIDKTFGIDLAWCVKCMACKYFWTVRDEDKETPLSLFFSPARINGYLKFGTLDKQVEVLGYLFKFDLEELEEGRMQDLLTRVCKISPAFSRVRDTEDWERVRNMSRSNLDFSIEFCKAMLTKWPRPDMDVY